MGRRARALERIVRSGAAYQASAILSAGLAFATYNAYTGTIGQPLIGIADLVLAWLILFSIFGRLGFGEALLRHWYTATDRERPGLQRTVQRAIFVTSAVLAIVVSILAPVIAPFFALPGATADAGIVRIAAAGVFFYCNLDMAQTVLRARDDRRTYLFATVSNVLLTTAFTVLLVVILDGGVRGYLAGNYAASGMVLVALWWRERGVLLGRVRSEPAVLEGHAVDAPAESAAAAAAMAPDAASAPDLMRPQSAGPGSTAPPAAGVAVAGLESPEQVRAASRGDLRALLRFGLPTLPTDAAIFAFNLLDRTILKIAAPGAGFFAGYALGVFSGASKIAAGVILIARAFQLAFPPLAYSIVDAASASRVYASALRGYAVVLGATVVGVTLCAPWTVEILIDPKAGIADPRPGVIEILPLLTAAWALWGVIPVMTTIAGRLGATKLTVPAAIAGLVVNLVALLLLVPPYGAKGAAIALVLAYVVLIAALNLMTRRYFPVAFDVPRIGASLILCTGFAASAGLLADAPDLGWGPAAIRLAMFAVLIALLWRIGLERTERDEIKSVGRRLVRVGR